MNFGASFGTKREMLIRLYVYCLRLIATHAIYSHGLVKRIGTYVVCTYNDGHLERRAERCGINQLTVIGGDIDESCIQRIDSTDFIDSFLYDQNFSERNSMINNGEVADHATTPTVKEMENSYSGII